MTPELNAKFDRTSVYTDFTGLAELKRQAKSDPDVALRKVAEQFEAIFMQMMLKSMRDANFGDPMFDNNQSEFYQGMHDSQLSMHMSKKGGMGLADMLVQQLSQRPATLATEQKDVQQYVSQAVHAVKTTIDAPVKESKVEVTATQDEEQVSNADNNAIEATSFKPFDGPADFVKRIWNMATDAATEIGTHPAVLVAQAALETGWGKYIQQHSDGKSSFNLFNIKADTRWDNDKITVSTLEYKNGVAVKQSADFRSYSSLQESFDDYVNFIKSSARYQQAVEQAVDPEAYIDELHKAGYATDPRYSSKIKGIMNGDVFGEALDEVASAIKVSQNETLS